MAKRYSVLIGTCEWYDSFQNEDPGIKPIGSLMTTRGGVTEIPYCVHPNSNLPKEKFFEVTVPRNKWTKCGGKQDSPECEVAKNKLSDIS